MIEYSSVKKESLRGRANGKTTSGGRHVIHVSQRQEIMQKRMQQQQQQQPFRGFLKSSSGGIQGNSSQLGPCVFSVQPDLAGNHNSLQQNQSVKEIEMWMPSSRKQPSRSSLYSFDMAERDKAALRLGKTILAEMSGDDEGGQECPQDMLHSASRFFVDRWLQEVNSKTNSDKASALSINLLARMDLAKTLANLNKENTNDDQSTSIQSIRAMALIACETLDQLVAGDGSHEPILNNLRAALYPALFIEETQPCLPQNTEDPPEYSRRKMWLDISEPQELVDMRVERRLLLERTDNMERRMLQLEEIISNQKLNIEEQQKEINSLQRQLQMKTYENTQLILENSKRKEENEADHAKFTEELVEKTHEKEIAIGALTKRCNEKIHNYQTEISNITELWMNVKSQLEEANKKLETKDAETFDQIQGLKAANVKLKKVLDQMNKDFKKAEEGAKVAQAEVGFFQRKCQALETRILELDTIMRSQQVQLMEAMNLKPTDYISKKKFEAAIASHKKELESVKNIAKRDLDELKSFLQKRHDDELALLKQQLKDASTVARGKAQRNSYTEPIPTITLEEAANYQSEIKQLRTLVSEKEVEIKTVMLQEETLKRKLQLEQMNVDHLMQSKDSAEKSAKNLFFQLENLRANHSKELDQEHKHTAKLALRVKTLEQNLDKAKEDLSTSSKDAIAVLDKAQAEKQQLLKDLESLQLTVATLYRLEIKLKKLAARIKEQKDADTQTESNDDAMTHATEVHTVGSQTLAVFEDMDLEELEKHIEQLRSNLKSDLDLIAQLKVWNESSEKEKEEMAARIKLHEEQNELLNAEKDKMKKTFEQMEEQIKQQGLDLSRIPKITFSPKSTQTEEDEAAAILAQLREENEDLKQGLAESGLLYEHSVTSSGVVAKENGLLKRRINELESLCKSLEKGLNEATVIGNNSLESDPINDALRQLQERKGAKELFGTMKKLGVFKKKPNLFMGIVDSTLKKNLTSKSIEADADNKETKDNADDNNKHKEHAVKTQVTLATENIDQEQIEKAEEENEDMGKAEDENEDMAKAEDENEDMAEAEDENEDMAKENNGTSSGKRSHKKKKKIQGASKVTMPPAQGVALPKIDDPSNPEALTVLGYTRVNSDDQVKHKVMMPAKESESDILDKDVPERRASSGKIAVFGVRAFKQHVTPGKLFRQHGSTLNMKDPQSSFASDSTLSTLTRNPTHHMNNTLSSTDMPAASNANEKPTKNQQGVKTTKEANVTALLARKDSVIKDDIAQNISLLSHMQKQIQEIEGSAPSSPPKLSKFTLAKLAQLKQKADALSNRVEKDGGWRKLLYQKDGKPDLEFDIKPWPVLSQVEVLKEINTFLEKELELEAYNSNKKLVELQTETEEQKKEIDACNYKIEGLTQTVKELQKKMKEYQDAAPKFAIAAGSKDHNEVAAFMTDLDAFLEGVKGLVLPKNFAISPEQECPVDENEDKNVWDDTVVTDILLERRRSLSPVRYTVNSKQGKTKASLSQNSSLSSFPSTVKTSSLRKVTRNNMNMHMPKPALLTVNISKKKMGEQIHESPEETPGPPEVSVANLLQTRKSIMSVLLDSIKARVLLGDVWEGRTYDDELGRGNENLKARLEFLNQQILMHQQMAKKLQKQMESHVVLEKDIEAKEVERFYLSNIMFHKNAPDSFLQWADKRQATIDSYSALGMAQTKVIADNQVAKTFVKDAGYSMLNGHRPGTAPARRSLAKLPADGNMYM